MVHFFLEYFFEGGKKIVSPYFWTSMEAPSSELSIPLDQFSKPKSQSCRLPRTFLPGPGNPGIVHGILGEKQDWLIQVSRKGQSGLVIQKLIDLSIL